MLLMQHRDLNVAGILGSPHDMQPVWCVAQGLQLVEHMAPSCSKVGQHWYSWLAWIDFKVTLSLTPSSILDLAIVFK